VTASGSSSSWSWLLALKEEEEEEDCEDEPAPTARNAPPMRHSVRPRQARSTISREAGSWEASSTRKAPHAPRGRPKDANVTASITPPSYPQLSTAAAASADDEEEEEDDEEDEDEDDDDDDEEEEDEDEEDDFAWAEQVPWKDEL
jgi:hypothetical protein